MNGNRILTVSLRNIKSVDSGTFSFPEAGEVEKGNFEALPCGIVGIYGQNGSGKTTVTEAFRLLKLFSLGLGVNSYDDKGQRNSGAFDFFVSALHESGFMEFSFLIFSEGKPYKMIYRAEFKRKKGAPCFLSKETLTVFPFFATGEAFKHKLAPIVIDYETTGIEPLYDGVAHEDGHASGKMDKEGLDWSLRITAQKMVCVKEGSSLLFSLEFRNHLVSSKIAKVKEMGNCLWALFQQIGFNLFVYGNRDDSMPNVGRGCVLGVYKDEMAHSETHGLFALSDSPFKIKKSELSHYGQFIEQINYFVSSFFPGFKLRVDERGTEKSKDGVSYVTIAIMRSFGGAEIPLSEESAGIKKLCSIACGLVYVYGNPSAWLVVDELDSGVYENLLGQILDAMEKNGKGQLLFTAHNLGPLERLPYKSVVFTTANKDNRYVLFSRPAPSNNLRDLYIRALRLGGQKEPLSSDVDTDDIDGALWKASSLAGKIKDGSHGEPA